MENNDVIIGRQKINKFIEDMREDDVSAEPTTRHELWCHGSLALVDKTDEMDRVDAGSGEEALFKLTYWLNKENSNNFTECSNYEYTDDMEESEMDEEEYEMDYEEEEEEDEEEEYEEYEDDKDIVQDYNEEKEKEKGVGKLFVVFKYDPSKESYLGNHLHFEKCFKFTRIYDDFVYKSVDTLFSTYDYAGSTKCWEYFKGKKIVELSHEVFCEAGNNFCPLVSNVKTNDQLVEPWWPQDMNIAV